MNKNDSNFIDQIFFTDPSSGEKSRIIHVGNDKDGNIEIYTASKSNIKEDKTCMKHTIKITEVLLEDIPKYEKT